MSYADEMMRIRRNQVEAELAIEGERLKAIDAECDSRREYEEVLQQRLVHEERLHQAKVRHALEKAAAQRELSEADLSLEMAGIESAQEGAAIEYDGIALQRGGRATAEVLNRERLARAAAPPPDTRSLDALTEAVRQLVNMQNAPRVILRDKNGMVTGVKIGDSQATPLPYDGGGRDARKA